MAISIDETYSTAARRAERIAAKEFYQHLSESDRNHFQKVIYNSDIQTSKDIDREARQVYWFIIPTWLILSVLGQWQIDIISSQTGLSWRTAAMPALCILTAFCGFAFPMAAVVHDDNNEDRGAPITARPKRVAKICLSTTPSLLVLALSMLTSPAGALGPLLSIVVTTLALALAIAGWALILTNLISLLERALGPRVDPRDLLISNLAHILEEATEHRHWRSSRVERRRLAKKIENAATRVHDRLPLIVRPTQPAVRASLGDLSARIATHLTGYASDIAIGGAERDQETVGKIAASLLSASFGKWEDLAADEASHPMKKLLRRLTPRVALAALLGTASAMSPVLFGSWAEQFVSQLRIALAVAAILSIVDTPKSATERIAEVFKSR